MTLTEALPVGCPRAQAVVTHQPIIAQELITEQGVVIGQSWTGEC